MGALKLFREGKHEEIVAGTGTKFWRQREKRPGVSPGSRASYDVLLVVDGIGDWKTCDG